MDIQRVRELFNFDPDSGVLFWRRPHGRWGRVPAGPVSPVPDSYGYLRITVDGKSFRVHRLCWTHYFGAQPIGDIDHINGVKTDNRIANLRDVSESLNMQNQRTAQRNCRAGLLGVRERRGSRGITYAASIRINGKQVHIGTFKTPEEAHSAYLSAKRMHHPGCTI